MSLNHSERKIKPQDFQIKYFVDHRIIFDSLERCFRKVKTYFRLSLHMRAIEKSLFPKCGLKSVFVMKRYVTM